MGNIEAPRNLVHGKIIIERSDTDPTAVVVQFETPDMVVVQKLGQAQFVQLLRGMSTLALEIFGDQVAAALQPPHVPDVGTVPPPFED